MVASIVRKARHKDSPISFVVARIDSRTVWQSDEVRAEHSQGVRDLLLRCLQSDLDVLLPKIGSAAAAELVFILAVTDQIGGDAIVQRIQRRMNRSEYVQQAALTVSASCRLLAALDTNVAESTEDSVARVSGEIQQLINSELTSRRMTDAD
jgi:hypothetical protein